MFTVKKKAWYCVGLSEEFKNSDQSPASRIVCETPISLLRLTNGEMAAFLSLCPHRAANLNHGTCEHNVLTCPYHGWSFDLTAKGGALKRFPVIERNGYVYVWPGDDRDGTLWDEGPIGIPDISGERSRVLVRQKVVKANYFHLIDNALDDGHINYLHPEIIAGRPRSSGAIIIDNDRGIIIRKSEHDELFFSLGGSLYFMDSPDLENHPDRKHLFVAHFTPIDDFNTLSIIETFRNYDLGEAGTDNEMTEQVRIGNQDEIGIRKLMDLAVRFPHHVTFKDGPDDGASAAFRHLMESDLHR